jgi:carboxypeptidase Taq
MSTSTKKLLQNYYQNLKVLKAFSAAESLLGWDRETWMPKDASPDRGETMAVLSGFMHDLFTDKKFVKIVDQLVDQQDQLDAFDRRSVLLTKRDLDKSVKLPKKFVEETQELLNASHNAWIEAKQTNNFELFEPLLTKVIDNRKKYAQLLDPNRDAYDVQLDDYEEGLKQERLDPLFTDLKSGIKKLLPQILEKQAKQPETKNPFDQYELDHRDLEEVIKEMVGTIGYDWNRGAMGHVEHPFETSISANDVRLNTRFEKTNNSFTVTGMIHELGHGMYEQNVDPKYQKSLFLAHGVSLGIHESQSRLLENFIGRSLAFWKFFFPKYQARFPQLKKWTTEQLVNSLNHVQPSFVRTESDEVTYNLHIILRYELEKALMHGDLHVKELPEVWRAKMKELIGVEPKTNKEGVLQDVHWSWGNLGYFPTYTLGNLNAAQLWKKFIVAHPDWEKEMSSGNFTCYTKWFKEHVWQHGSFFTPDELMKKATGESTNAKYFLEYLEQKFLS